jgi:hypothetical protein
MRSRAAPPSRGQTNSIAILFRLMDFYCDGLMYFHSDVDREMNGYVKSRKK